MIGEHRHILIGVFPVRGCESWLNSEARPNRHHYFRSLFKWERGVSRPKLGLRLGLRLALGLGRKLGLSLRDFELRAGRRLSHLIRLDVQLGTDARRWLRCNRTG